MAILYTNYQLVSMTIGEFNAYIGIQAAPTDATTAVQLGLLNSGLISFLDKLGMLSAEIFGAAGSDTITAGNGSDTIWGGDGNDELFGRAGADIIRGGQGEDRLYGGLGIDTLSGGHGNDWYFVDRFNDRVTEQLDSGVDTVFAASGNFRLAANIENLTASGFVDFRGYGNQLANVITGGTGKDQLFGGGGGDTIHGGSDDTLIGGAGDDTYYLTDGNTSIIVETADGGNDTLFTDSAVNSPIAGLENITAIGSDNARLTGNDLANVLIGNEFANEIFGNSGNDTITGGAFIDSFFFYDTDSVDTITDFTPADDSIMLINTGFGGLAYDGGRPLDASEFKVISSGAEDSSDRILYNNNTGALFYDADGAGGIDAVLFAILQHHPFLTPQDVQLTA